MARGGPPPPGPSPAELLLKKQPFEQRLGGYAENHPVANGAAAAMSQKGLDC